MATVLVLDRSLSMGEYAPDSRISKLSLAVTAISSLIEYSESNAKQELFSLISYSSESICIPFSRSREHILSSALRNITLADKSCHLLGLNAATNMLLDNADAFFPNNHVIWFTDGRNWIDDSPIGCVNSDDHRLPDDLMKIPASLHVFLIAKSCPSEIQRFSRFVEMATVSGQGQVWCVGPDRPLSEASVVRLMADLCRACYSPFFSQLVCGSLSGWLQVQPPPVECSQPASLEICGFLDISSLISSRASDHLVDFRGTPFHSRHLVTAVPADLVKAFQAGTSSLRIDKLLSNGSAQADLAVIIHGSLKTTGSVALVRLAAAAPAGAGGGGSGLDRFGCLHTHADSKKRSSLALSLFRPGSQPVQWLPDFTRWSTIETGSPFQKLALPPNSARSYSTSTASPCAVWIRPATIQSDIQKVLRHARRLPDKQSQFYKELNRIRRAALSLGMTDCMFNMMATMLTELKESIPDVQAHAHLDHAVTCLNDELYRAYDNNIPPMSS